jgi:hypothetical protein
VQRPPHGDEQHLDPSVGLVDPDRVGDLRVARAGVERGELVAAEDHRPLGSQPLGQPGQAVHQHRHGPHLAPDDQAAEAHDREGPGALDLDVGDRGAGDRHQAPAGGAQADVTILGAPRQTGAGRAERRGLATGQVDPVAQRDGAELDELHAATLWAAPVRRPTNTSSFAGGRARRVAVATPRVGMDPGGAT